MTSRPSAGSGSGSSTTRRTSGPPNSVIWMARTAAPQVVRVAAPYRGSVSGHAARVHLGHLAGSRGGDGADGESNDHGGEALGGRRGEPGARGRCTRSRGELRRDLHG